MRVRSLGVTATVFLFALSSCSSRPDVAYIDRDASLRISDKELASAKKKALGGDGKEAFAIFVHYAFGLDDHKHADPWLRLALKNGNATARDHAKQWQIAQPSEYARFAKEKTLPRLDD